MIIKSYLHFIFILTNKPHDGIWDLWSLILGQKKSGFRYRQWISLWANESNLVLPRAMMLMKRAGASNMSWQRWMQSRGARCRKDATIGIHSAANHDLCIHKIRLQSTKLYWTAWSPFYNLLDQSHSWLSDTSRQRAKRQTRDGRFCLPGGCIVWRVKELADYLSITKVSLFAASGMKTGQKVLPLLLCVFERGANRVVSKESFCLQGSKVWRVSGLVLGSGGSLMYPGSFIEELVNCV